jgi:hypothetical protein
MFICGPRRSSFIGIDVDHKHRLNGEPRKCTICESLLYEAHIATIKARGVTHGTQNVITSLTIGRPQQSHKAGV